MVKSVLILATFLCLLNTASQANGDSDELLLQSEAKSHYQLTYPGISKDYENAVAEIDTIFKKENKLTDELSKKVESYADGTTPRHDIALFLLTHIAKKVKREDCLIMSYGFTTKNHAVKNSLRLGVINYVSKHFEVTPVSFSRLENNKKIQDSLCGELQECVKFLSGRHGLLYGLNKQGYKDTIDNKSDREHYEQFVETEEQLLDILINYDSFTGFMITNVTFRGVLQQLPSYQLYLMGENTRSFVRYYPKLESFSIGFDAVRHGDFLYSFLYDESAENPASFFFMKKFLQRKSEIYEKAYINEEATIERLRLKLAELTGKVENSSFGDNYTALLDQYGLSQGQRLSQDSIEEMKKEYVYKLALATTASEKIKENHKDIEQQLETLTIIRDKFATLLARGQQTRNKWYYDSYNPRRDNTFPYMLDISLGCNF